MATSETKQFILSTDVLISVTSTRPPTNFSNKNAPTIVFLHYWGGSSLTWSRVIPWLSLDFSTIAIDFRGWGNSTGPPSEAAYSIQALADDVRAVLELLRPESVILVGLSMGAKVAQLATVQLNAAHERDSTAVEVQGLMLVSPAPVTPLVLPSDMRQQQLHAYDTAETATLVARNVLTTTFQDRDLPHFVVSDMLRGNALAKAAWPVYAMQEDISTAVGNLQTPTMILAAELDTIEPLDRVKLETCARLPGAQLCILAGSGHLSPLDAPEALSQHILRFSGQFSSK